MKRCPQCNRVEADEALKFCRVDGATLVSDSSSSFQEAGTAKLGSGSVSREIETGALPERTDANINRATAPTTVLPAQPLSATNNFTITTYRRLNKKAIAVIVTAIVAAVTAAVVISYRI